MTPAADWNGVKVFIKKTVDYTVRRRGDEVYTAVDRYGRMIWEVGCWKSFQSCKNFLELLGYDCGQCRLPLTGPTEETLAGLKAALPEL